MHIRPQMGRIIRHFCVAILCGVLNITTVADPGRLIPRLLDGLPVSTTEVDTDRGDESAGKVEQASAATDGFRHGPRRRTPHRFPANLPLDIATGPRRPSLPPAPAPSAEPGGEHAHRNGVGAPCAVDPLSTSPRAEFAPRTVTPHSAARATPR